MKQMTVNSTINNKTTMIKEETTMMNVKMTETNNMEFVTRGEFGGSTMSQTEEIEMLSRAINDNDVFSMNRNGEIMTSSDIGNKPEEGNYTQSKPGTLAAWQGDQWYARNKLIYDAEVAGMTEHYPYAKMGFLQKGNMYWIVNVHPSKTGAIEPYTVMLKYEKNHPANDSFGGSIRCVLLKPTVAELMKKARAAGRKDVPHLLSETKDGESFVYLCTRLPNEVAAGKSNFSAVQAVGYAADWILRFELGLRDKELWNHKFCGPAHKSCWVV